MAESPILDITYLVDEQNQAEVKVNELINRLESMAIMIIQDRDDTAPPATPANGDVYIPTATATGDWAGHEDELAIYYDGWTFVDPVSGMIAFVKDEKIWIGYSEEETDWHPMQRTWSTTEYWTGEYYQTAKLYAKSFDVGALPNSAQTTDAHGITGLALIAKIIATADDGTNQIDFSSGWDNVGAGSSDSIDLIINDTNIVIDADFDASGFDGYVTLEYTKA